MQKHTTRRLLDAYVALKSYMSSETLSMDMSLKLVKLKRFLQDLVDEYEKQRLEIVNDEGLGSEMKKAAVEKLLSQEVEVDFKIIPWKHFPTETIYPTVLDGLLDIVVEMPDGDNSEAT